MAKIKITQVVSRIGSTARQKKNLDALGLKKTNRSVVHEDSPIIVGMVAKVKHLVKVEVVEAGTPVTKKVAAPEEALPKAGKAETAPKKVAAPKAKATPKAKVEKEPVKED